MNFRDFTFEILYSVIFFMVITRLLYYLCIILRRRENVLWKGINIFDEFCSTGHFKKSRPMKKIL